MLFCQFCGHFPHVVGVVHDVGIGISKLLGDAVTTFTIKGKIVAELFQLAVWAAPEEFEVTVNVCHIARVLVSRWQKYMT